MAVVISVHVPWGCIGRCDKNCYNALGTECHCICGGLNHGVGWHQATENSKRLTDEQIRANISPYAQGQIDHMKQSGIVRVRIVKGKGQQLRYKTRRFMRKATSRRRFNLRIAEIKENRNMELEQLIQELDNLIGEADLAADAGDENIAREHLRKAKELLEEEFLAE